MFECTFWARPTPKPKFKSSIPQSYEPPNSKPYESLKSKAYESPIPTHYEYYEPLNPIALRVLSLRVWGFGVQGT